MKINNPKISAVKLILEWIIKGNKTKIMKNMNEKTYPDFLRVDLVIIDIT